MVEAARTLLQELGQGTTEDQAQPILAAVLDKIVPTQGASWSGLVRGIGAEEVPVALWELLARRWLVAYEQSASDDLLARVANLIADNLSTHIDPAFITISSTTARLLRRADFWELARLQPHLRAALLTRVALPSLSPPAAVLEAAAAAKAPKALRALDVGAVMAVVGRFATLTALLPMEYAGRALSGQLVEHAVSLDVWLTAGKVEGLNEDERAQAQEVLRRFALLALGNRTAALNNAPAVLAHLVKNTTSSAPTLVAITIELYAHFAQAAASNPEQVLPYLSAFDDPLKALAKRSKKAAGPLTCEELALFELCGALAGHLPARGALPAAVGEAVEALAGGASKAFAKTVGYVGAAVEADAGVVVELADLVRGCQAFWSLKDYLEVGTVDHEQVEVYSTFAQTVLGALLAQTVVVDAVKDLAVRQAMLDLLTFRVARLRTVSDSAKLSVLPFETLIACHLAFRQTLADVPGAATALHGSLKRASVAASLREYEAALNGVTGAIAGAVAGEASLAEAVATLRPALEVASVLLRDAPEGSSKLSAVCLADLLRHASLFLIRHGSGANESTGAAVAEAFLLVARFVEGVCADRPLLLSRQNVGAVLSLASRVLAPSPGAAAADASAEPTSSATSSALFLSLTASVSHLVRHHKEHLTQLFPQLVQVIAGLVGVLRRAGYGTTGAAVVDEQEQVGGGGGGEVGGVVGLGRKAEREARETFPFWAWEGGAAGLGRAEAKAVSRLLSSLTTKTASTERASHKRPAAGTATDAPTKPRDGSTKDPALSSLAAPLSKHAPFLLLAYLRACVHPTAPVPSGVRQELQGGWYEVMDCLGKWEREALMKGFLGEAEGAERGVLRGMWKGWEGGRYRG